MFIASFHRSLLDIFLIIKDDISQNDLNKVKFAKFPLIGASPHQIDNKIENFKNLARKLRVGAPIIWII